MTNVKLYHVGDNGLQEGEALGRISVVLKAGYEVEVGELQAEVDFLMRRATDLKNERDTTAELVTSLTSENSRLNVALESEVISHTMDLSSDSKMIESLEVELTKARELLNQQEDFISSAWQWLPIWLRKTYKQFAHQSAPVAKGDKCLDGGTCGLGGFCKDCHNLK